MAQGDGAAWKDATERMVQLIKTGEDPMGGELPEGYGSGTLLEQFAREISAEHGTDLGMSLPVVLGAYSAAMQGGFLTPILRRWNPPQYLHVSTVIQFLGIAPAGQLKSTLLAEVGGPLKAALDGSGAEHRAELVKSLRDKAVATHEGGVIPKVVDNWADWERVYGGGLCPSSWTDSGTPEAVRLLMAQNGSHRAVLTAEPDVLRDVSAYSNGKGGSLRHLLSGWDQEESPADRVGTDPRTIEPSLPCVIMLQPESFQKYTTGGADGSDDFVERGVFSRMLMWRGQNAPMALDDFDLDLDNWDPETWSPETGSVPALEKLRLLVGESMADVVRRTNGYRVSKGILREYQHKTPIWGMPKPPLAARIKLGLDGAEGHRAAWRVQHMRKVLIDTVEMELADRSGHSAVLLPFAQRFTSHVMRLAAVQSVGVDAMGCTVVDTDFIEDVAVRLMPWLLGGWWRIMSDRLEDNAQVILEKNTKDNHKGAELTGVIKVVNALAALSGKHGEAASVDGFTKGAVIKQAKLTFPKIERAKVHALLEREFDAALAEGLITPYESPGVVANAAGTVYTRYGLTAQGKKIAGS